MKTILSVILLTAAIAAQGQSDPQERNGLNRTAPRPVATTASAVTESEARNVLLRAERVLRTALKLNGTASSRLSAANRPVTRAQVVSEFARLHALVAPKACFSPRPVRYESQRLKMSGPEGQKLAMLVRLGAVAPVGPLAAGPKNSLTVAEFGDALGFFLSRMAEITHMPSRKWTPALQDE